MPKPKHDDVLTGTNGNDTLDGRGASVIMRGGRGDDTYHVDDLRDIVDEKNNGGTDTVFSSINYILPTGTEALVLTGGDDLSGAGNDDANMLTGNDGANLLEGFEGADVFDGGAGDDTIFGGAGDDKIFASDGDDSYNGGLGTDEVVYAGAFREYEVTRDGETIFVWKDDDWSHSLTGIESLVFADKSLASEDIDSDIGPASEILAADDVVTIQEDEEVILAVLSNDAGEGLRVADAANGERGLVTINDDGTITYRPHENVSGQDSFIYTVVDAYGQTTSATVTVDILAVNDAPVANADVLALVNGELYESDFSLLDNDSDPDGDPLTVIDFDAVSGASGTVSVAENGAFSYVPADGFEGTDTFSYTVRDADGMESIGSVEVEVLPPLAEPAPEADPVLEMAPEPMPEPEPEPDAAPEPMPEPDAAPEPAPEPEPTALPYYIEGLISAAEQERVNWPDEVGSAGTVTFTFLTAAPSYVSETDPRGIHQTFQAFSEQQQQATVDILAGIESYTNLEFVAVDSADAATITFGFFDMGSGVNGTATSPYGASTGDVFSDVWLNSSFAGDMILPESEGYFTLLHEIGHSIGLEHATLPPLEENQQYTVMDSTGHPTMSGYMSTYQLYDIAALQHLYGSDTVTTAGDDVYAFDDLSENILTIWDAGGHDTLDLSSADHGLAIDLNEGAFSSVSAKGSENIAIAFDTEIEDAIGGDFDDVLQGNDLDNVLTGGSGNDALTGGAGADTFHYGAEWGQDSISDFTAGEDVIDLTETGLTLSDIAILFQEAGVVIEAGNHSILLENEEEFDETSLLF